MNIFNNVVRVFACIALGLPTASFATNGYFVIGFGGEATAMGGAAVAFPQSSLCAGANPACLSSFQRMQMDAGIGLFEPRRRSGETGLFAGGNSWSGANLYVIPGMGVVFPYSDKLSLGFAALGNGGAGTKYDPNFFSRGGATKYLGVDMLQLIVPITASYRVTPDHAIGVSIVPARQRFLAQGLQAFQSYSSNPDFVTNKGHDYANGIGARIGWLGQFWGGKLSLGATYASKIYMQKFSKYKGLFAEEGDFDVPANYAIGMAIRPIDKVTVAFDVARILYSDIASVGNPGPSAILYSGDPIYDTVNHPLGSRDGGGFGWKDQTVYKLGVRYDLNDKWVLRAGYNYGKSPIPDSQLLFNLLAPAVVEKHYTAGFTYNVSDDDALTFSYHRAARRSQSALLVFDNVTPVAASVELFQNVFEIGYTLKF